MKMFGTSEKRLIGKILKDISTETKGDLKESVEFTAMLFVTGVEAMFTRTEIPLNRDLILSEAIIILTRMMSSSEEYPLVNLSAPRAGDTIH